MSNFITCLYRTVLEVKYLFHAGSARNYLFHINHGYNVGTTSSTLGRRCINVIQMFSGNEA